MLPAKGALKMGCRGKAAVASNGLGAVHGAQVQFQRSANCAMQPCVHPTTWTVGCEFARLVESFVAVAH